MTNKKYIMSQQDRYNFSAILLLEYMINHHVTYPIVLLDDQQYLEPILIEMNGKRLVEIDDSNHCYNPTSNGRKLLEGFYQKLFDFQSVFDIFSAVDLGAGEFAMSSYFDFEDDDEYDEFLDDERWEDCRVAVAEFKKINPLEIIFMSFINEGRFEFQDGWEFDLHSQLIWDEIVDIANSNLSVQQIEDAGAEHGMEDVVETLIKEGIEQMKAVKQQEADFEAELEEEEAEEEYYDDEEEVIIEYVEEVEEYYVEDYDAYYDPWYDPWYVPPIWVAAAILI